RGHSSGLRQTSWLCIIPPPPPEQVVRVASPFSNSGIGLRSAIYTRSGSVQSSLCARSVDALTLFDIPKHRALSVFCDCVIISIIFVRSCGVGNFLDKHVIRRYLRIVTNSLFPSKKDSLFVTCSKFPSATH
ncbi:hypothetical protein WA026_009063, partial [Henosepilachna vigintioctopunctata]